MCAIGSSKATQVASSSAFGTLRSTRCRCATSGPIRPIVLRCSRLPTVSRRTGSQTHLTPMVEVSDRFHLIPLLRAITFPHTAYVLVLSENAVRLVEIFADHPPVTAKIADMPKDAASAVGKATLNDRSPSGRIQGSEGQNVRLNQYARKVDAALRPILAGRDTPLILAAPDRLASIYRSVNSYPHLLEQTLGGNSERASDAELSVAVRAILDAWYQSELGQFRSVYETRANSGRATSDLSDAARAATFGAIDVLLVDIDSVTPGSVDEFQRSRSICRWAWRKQLLHRRRDCRASPINRRKSTRRPEIGLACRRRTCGRPALSDLDDQVGAVCNSAHPYHMI